MEILWGVNIEGPPPEDVFDSFPKHWPSWTIKSVIYIVFGAMWRSSIWVCRSTKKSNFYISSSTKYASCCSRFILSIFCTFRPDNWIKLAHHKSASCETLIYFNISALMCESFYVLLFLFFPALCKTIINIVTNNCDIHSIVLVLSSLKLDSEFS